MSDVDVVFGSVWIWGSLELKLRKSLPEIFECNLQKAASRVTWQARSLHIWKEIPPWIQEIPLWCHLSPSLTVCEFLTSESSISVRSVYTRRIYTVITLDCCLQHGQVQQKICAMQLLLLLTLHGAFLSRN